MNSALHVIKYNDNVMASKRGLLDLGVIVASATAGYYFYSRNEFWFGQPNNPDDATRNPSDFNKTLAAMQEIQKQEKNETAQQEPTDNDVMQWIKSEIMKW